MACVNPAEAPGAAGATSTGKALLARTRRSVVGESGGGGVDSGVTIRSRRECPSLYQALFFSAMWKSGKRLCIDKIGSCTHRGDMTRQRNTRQRTAIEAVFDTIPRPLGPSEVWALARAAVPNLGIATVYRALNDLVEEHRLRAVELPGQTPRYERAGLKHHHHFHCRSCDKVFDLDGCMLKADLKLPPGFTVKSHDITLSGFCPDCADAAPVGRSP